MKVCIIGLGAIGGTLAGAIAAAHPDGAVQLSALARGATLAAVQQHGLRVESAAGSLVTRLRASDDPATLGVQDLVILAVKAPSLRAAAPAVRMLCGPGTQVLCAMNGVPWWFFDGVPGPLQGLSLPSVDADGSLRRLLPSSQVVGCVVHLSSVAAAPAVVRHVNGRGLIIGHALGGIDARLQALGDLFTRAGFDITLSPQIQRELWFKLWGNMTMNPVSALTGAPCDQILDDPLVRDFISAVMREAQAIGAAFGIPIDQAPEQRHAVTRRLGSFKTSMLQDAEAGRPLEIDALLGAVREIGAHLGQHTPAIDALLGLVRLMARQRGLLAD